MTPRPHDLQVKAVEVQRFYRPEDISRERAYKASLREVYASMERCTIDLSAVVAPCSVAASAAAAGALGTVIRVQTSG